jgi:hypothetical protein
MHAAIVVSFLCSVFFSTVVSGNAVFRGLSSWSKPARKVERKVQHCLQLRGGSSEGETSEKVKGVCIGIDLGTTYR